MWLRQVSRVSGGLRAPGFHTLTLLIHPRVFPQWPDEVAVYPSLDWRPAGQVPGMPDFPTERQKSRAQREIESKT